MQAQLTHLFHLFDTEFLNDGCLNGFLLSIILRELFRSRNVVTSLVCQPLACDASGILVGELCVDSGEYKRSPSSILRPLVVQISAHSVPESTIDLAVGVDPEDAYHYWGNQENVNEENAVKL